MLPDKMEDIQGREKIKDATLEPGSESSNDNEDKELVSEPVSKGRP